MAATPPLTLLAPTAVMPSTRETLAEAISAGRLSGRRPAVPESFQVQISSTGPIDLAETAVTEALRTADVEPGAVESLLYAFTFYQGSHFFSPAHAVAHRARLDCAVPIGIQQMCNGAGAALSLAHRLAAAGDTFTSVIASSDVFPAPGFDRWSGDYGIVYGDAATAVIATNDVEVIDHARGPICTVAATATAALPQLEAMHYDPENSTTDPAKDWPVDVRRTKKRYLERHGKDALQKSMQLALEELVEQVTVTATAAGSQPNGKVWLPRLLPETIDSIYLPAIQRSTPLPSAEHAATGHLGAGDLIANLADCTAQPMHASATHLFVSAGAGFTITVTAITVDPGGIS